MSGPSAGLRHLPEGFVARKLADLRTRQETARTAPATTARQGLQEAACVLSAFDPGRLTPFGFPLPSATARESVRLEFLADCEPISDAPTGLDWRLRTGVRRAALRRLGSRTRMQQALAVNPERDNGPLQRMLEALFRGAPDLPPSSLQRDELLALATATRWLGGILDDLPDPGELERMLAQSEITEPLRRLAGTRFVGRKAELSHLAKFLDGPPGELLQVHGSGGIGKSTLLARFILDHALAGPASRSFVRLDADHPGLDPLQPLTFLAEALHQLAAQFRTVRADLLAIADMAIELIDRLDSSESVKSATILGSEEERVLAEVSDVLRGVLDGHRFLIVVDSFEAVQIVGEEVASYLLVFLTRFSNTVPEARVVVSGRVAVPDIGRRLPIAELEPEASIELLTAELAANDVTADADIVSEVVRRVGGNPMCLRFAAELLARSGREALDEADARGELLERVGVEARQARLYGRILAHLKDGRVRALALPSVILRRIDRAVIRHVLAGPCGLSVPDDDVADDIFRAMLREIALVEHDRDDGSLRHRPDVRETMLGLLSTEVHVSKLRVIEDAAIAFYASMQNSRARAEELYHRLRRGDPASALRWDPSAARFLATSLAELPLASRAWLAERLDVSISASERGGLAADEAWIAQAARVAERYVLGGRPEAALAALRERPAASPALSRLEAQALVLQGRLDEARVVAERGVALAEERGEHHELRVLLRHLAEILERRGAFEQAMVILNRAILGARSDAGDDDSDWLVQRLKGLVAIARIQRKAGSAFDDRRYATIEEIARLLPEVKSGTLHQQPALARELAAEVGHVLPGVLTSALEAIGLELDTDERLEAMARAAVEHGVADAGKIAEEIARSKRSFERYAQSVTQRAISGSEMPNDFAKSVVELFRGSVERTLGL